jgi:hypothetical protein
MAGALGRTMGRTNHWAARTIGLYKPRRCYGVFFISAIPATESIETWLISVSVCCLLLRLKALVCCLLFRFFGGAGLSVDGRTGRWQNRSKAEQCPSMAERVGGRTGQRQNSQRQTTITYLISSRDNLYYYYVSSVGVHIPRCTFCRSPTPAAKRSAKPPTPFPPPAAHHQRHFTPAAAIHAARRTIPAAHHSLRAEPIDQGFHPAVASPLAQSPLKGFHLPSRGRKADERPSINQRDPLPSIAIPFHPSQSTLAHSIAQSPLPHPWLQSVAPTIPFHPWRGRWLFSTVNRQHSLDLNPFAIRSCPSLAAQSTAQTLPPHPSKGGGVCLHTPRPRHRRP